MADPARARKLADRIKVVVAETLDRRVKDPRLGFITGTDARVTNDLQHATVFYTVFGDEAEKASTAAALESARGVLRSEVGRRTGIRLTPTLEFIADAVPENAAHIDDLLRRAAAHDAQVAEIAQSSDYAGESDPYRREDEEEPGEDEVPQREVPPVEDGAGQQPADGTSPR
jgi:ribosome-binding factor A